MKEGEGMRFKILKISLIIIIGIIMPLLYNCYFYSVNAEAEFNEDYYLKNLHKDRTFGTTKISEIGKIVIGTLRGAGIVISVLALIAIGIKYMTSSLEEKAKYKQILLPYFLGALIVFGISTILPIIVKLAGKI